MSTNYRLAILASAMLLTACASPAMEKLPKQQPGQATVIAYSSTLNPTSSLQLFINQKHAGDIQGDKVKVITLAPGQYDVRIAPPNVAVAVNKTINVQAEHYYFYDAYTTTSGRMRKTTYHLDPVDQQTALAYLQGPAKFTGWGDLVSNTLQGKRTW
jgi:hypothetical protein